jgi:hypothetical protein
VRGVLLNNARSAVADYRNNGSTGFSLFSATVLQRLEEDRDGKVSAALQNRLLRRARKNLLIFYLIQSVDLAQSASEVLDDCRARASSYREAAHHAKQLLQFCVGRAPIQLTLALRDLEKYLPNRLIIIPISRHD